MDPSNDFKMKNKGKRSPHMKIFLINNLIFIIKIFNFLIS